MIFEIILLFIAIELVLKLSDNNISFELTNYPFYTFKKNNRGKSPYYLERLGKAPTIKTNSEGLRGKITKNAILCTGCSFTEGAAHKTNNTYPGQLEKLLKQSVINAGIGGYGIFQINYMIKKIMKYQPKTVIVQLLDFKRISLNQKKIKKAKKKLIFYQRTKKFSHLLAYFLKSTSRSYVSTRKAYMTRNLTDEQLWKLNKQYLNQIKETCKNTRLIMFLWPNHLPNETYFSQKLKKYCQKNKIETFDPQEIFKHYRKEELQLKGDAHPSFLANKLIAKVIYNRLIKS